MSALAALFGVTAMLYASVGFGGGSTYTALLLLADVPVMIVPLLSLICNLIVVSGGAWRFAKSGLMPWQSVWPLVAVAAPLAFLGGLTPISEGALVLLLGGTLLLSAILLFFQPHMTRSIALPAPLLLTAAAVIGFLAGVVGIGGGIFLAPLLHLIRWAEARSIAASASLFILVNSLFGLAGQVIKAGDGRFHAALDGYWPLFVAVFIGGAIGSHMSVRRANPALIRRLTALLVAVVAMRLLGVSIFDRIGAAIGISLTIS